MFEGDDAYVRRSTGPMKAAGLAIQQHSPEDAARRYPQMGFRGVRTVYLEPEAGFTLSWPGWVEEIAAVIIVSAGFILFSLVARQPQR